MLPRLHRRRVTRATALLASLLLVVAGASTAGAQSPMERILERQFRARLERIGDSVHAVVGVTAIDLATGRAVGVNDSLTFPQGSAIKIPLLLELYRQIDAGTIAESERIPVRRADQAGGSGVAQWFADGTTAMSPHDLAVLMIVLSDNTATNILIDRVGGFDAVNSAMASLGVPAIRLQRKMIRPVESARGNENLATPATAAALMRRVASCDLPMSKARCATVRRLLEIPKGGPLLASVPAGVRVAWKPGSVEGVQTAWGIVDLPGRPYVLAAMVTYADDDGAERALRAVADAAYEYHRRLARASAYGVRVPLSVADSIRRPR